MRIEKEAAGKEKEEKNERVPWSACTGFRVRSNTTFTLQRTMLSSAVAVLPAPLPPNTCSSHWAGVVRRRTFLRRQEKETKKNVRDLLVTRGNRA